MRATVRTLAELEQLFCRLSEDLRVLEPAAANVSSTHVAFAQLPRDARLLSVSPNSGGGAIKEGKEEAVTHFGTAEENQTKPTKGELRKAVGRAGLPARLRFGGAGPELLRLPEKGGFLAQARHLQLLAGLFGVALSVPDGERAVHIIAGNQRRPLQQGEFEAWLKGQRLNGALESGEGAAGEDGASTSGGPEANNHGAPAGSHVAKLRSLPAGLCCAEQHPMRRSSGRALGRHHDCETCGDDLPPSLPRVKCTDCGVHLCEPCAARLGMYARSLARLAQSVRQQRPVEDPIRCFQEIAEEHEVSVTKRDVNEGLVKMAANLAESQKAALKEFEAWLWPHLFQQRAGEDGAPGGGVLCAKEKHKMRHHSWRRYHLTHTNRCAVCREPIPWNSEQYSCKECKTAMCLGCVNRKRGPGLPDEHEPGAPAPEPPRPVLQRH